LKEWAAELAGIPNWLFDESYYIAGDLGETIALLLPPPSQQRELDLSTLIKDLQKLIGLSPEERKEEILDYWKSLSGSELFVFNKLITGNFRMGVSRQLVIKALAQFLEVEDTQIAHQLMGKWNPENETLDSLFGQESLAGKHYQPYPFYLAYPLEGLPANLGEISNWIIERKLDGIRGQIIIRNDEIFVWSRGEDLLTDKFPEFLPLKEILPGGTVIDGEIIPLRDGKYLGFNEMQTRIGRKNLSKKIMTDVPLVMVCYDLLEWKGEDLRRKPLAERRQLLIGLLENHEVRDILILSEDLPFSEWEEVAEFRINARKEQCEGVMLKHRESSYESGRKRGNWWKWKTEPMTIDGVLIYAQSGHGRRANLFTDYTFAVWDEHGNLLPFAKAYSGLTDKEIVTLDNWVKRNTIEKFGPVRSVTPHWVFEIAFEGIAESPRHKSGIALRFPRILRWRQDKKASEANTISDLKDWLKFDSNE
jgi:DNA ligase-1